MPSLYEVGDVVKITGGLRFVGTIATVQKVDGDDRFESWELYLIDPRAKRRLGWLNQDDVERYDTASYPRPGIGNSSGVAAILLQHYRENTNDRALLDATPRTRPEPSVSTAWYAGGGSALAEDLP